MNNPKLVFMRAKYVFSMSCFTLAIYLAIPQIIRYLENKDTSRIMHKKFNEVHENNYPTFTICLRGKEKYWRHEPFLMDQLGVNSNQYADLLKGNGWKYKYDEKTRLYKKEYFNESTNISLDFSRTLIKASDIIVGTHFYARHENLNSHYGHGREPENIRKVPFQLSYESPDETCFTRNSFDELGLVRKKDSILLNRTLLNPGINLNMKLRIIFHNPGQLMRNFEKHAYLVRLQELQSNYVVLQKVSYVTKLKNRPGSNNPCYDGVLTDDSRFLQEVKNRIRCSPVFWKNLGDNADGLPICRSVYQYRHLDSLLSSFDEVSSKYDPPCTTINTLVTPSMFYRPNLQNAQINILYMDDLYLETENIMDFSFESFFSSIGGFFGIFLGYSLLQLPQMIGNIPSFWRNLKCKIYCS